MGTLRLKARARSEGGQIAVFFIDDNFAINVKHEIVVARHHCGKGSVALVAQISASLLRDEELIDLIAESGGKWVFIGMESIDPTNLAQMNKGFNKPGEYEAVLARLARRNVYAITSFISEWITTHPESQSVRFSKFEAGQPVCLSSAC